MGCYSIFFVLCCFSSLGGLSFAYTTSTYAHFSCGGTITSQYERIVSPNYPSSYDNNLRCTWTIDRPWYEEIVLKINHFSTEECCDRLQIINKNTGNDMVEYILQGHCYVREDGWFSTSSNHIELYFITDGSVVRNGFDITIESRNRSTYYFSHTTRNPTGRIVCENSLITPRYVSTPATTENTDEETTESNEPMTVATTSYFGSRDVYIEYGSSGRVYVESYEICTTGFDYYSGVKLCNYTGLSYNYYSSVSANRPYLTGRIECLDQCFIRPTRQYCSSVIYLYCYGSSSTESYSRTWADTTEDYSIDSIDVRIEYGTSGRVYIQGREVCTSTYNYQLGEALCRSKGYSYSYYTSVSPHDHYSTFEIRCYSDYISSCTKDFRYRYCSNVVYLYCYDTSTEETTTSTQSPTSSVPIDSIDVRIEYGTSGRVYIQGREVCTSTSNYQLGEVLCRSKGYSYSYYTSVSSHDHYSTIEIRCYSDYISSCTKDFRYHYCSNVVYLYCYDTFTEETTTSTQSPTSSVPIGYSNVSIENGTHGKVSVDGYEICADGITYQTSETLCYSKGYDYDSYERVYPNHHYGTMNVNCWNTYISSCSAEYKSRYCSFALYLRCNQGIRLVGTGYPWKGTIEIMHNGQWGTICDDSFDKRDGDVICRMLGYTHSSQTYQRAHYGQGSGPIWLDELGCYGNESDVTNCSSEVWGIHDCGHHEDAGVDCVNSTSTDYEMTTYDPCNGYQCYNGGTCFVRNNGYPDYYCVCPNGYSGRNCQYWATTFDPCYQYPCRHGGTCYRNYGYPGYYCLCPIAYSGQHCESYLSYYETTTYDPCYGYPCRHGGTCYRNYGYPRYYCACANGYTGQHCDASLGFSPENAISVGCMDNTWDISVYLPPFYNRYPDFDPSDLYLGTDSCTGYVNGNYLHFRSGYSACGTVTKTLTDNIVHTNQLVYALHDPNHHYIVHEYRFRVPVDCYMKRNEGGSGHFNHGHDVTIPAAHHVTGSSHHSVRLQFYTDSTFRYTKPLYGSRAGDTVYVRAYTDVRDYNLKMRISDCFTTPTSSSFSSLKYFIIQNGCVIDPNARILSQTTHETRFYFQDFEYSTNRDSLYLHCNATFCKSNDYSDACEQTCHHARKRVGGGNIVYGGPVDSMTVNEAVRLTKADDTRSSKSRGNSNMIAVLSVIFGIILITLIAFMVLGKVKKNRQKKSQIV